MNDLDPQSQILSALGEIRGTLQSVAAAIDEIKREQIEVRAQMRDMETTKLLAMQHEANMPKFHKGADLAQAHHGTMATLTARLWTAIIGVGVAIAGAWFNYWKAGY